jgi:hypothetical protein
MIWTFGLLIIGVRSKKWDLANGSDEGEAEEGRDIMGDSFWGAVCIMLLYLSPHPQTFSLLKSLRQTSRVSPFGNTAVSEDQDGERTLIHRHKILQKLRSDGWELATGVGLAGLFLIGLGWGIVGYKITGGKNVGANVFENLPLNDGWVNVVRVGILIDLLLSLRRILQPTQSFITRTGSWIMQGLEVLTNSAGRGGYSALVEANSGEDRDKRAFRKKLPWKIISKLVSEVTVWSGIVVMSILLGSKDGRSGKGVVDVAECAGGFGTALGGLLIPGRSSYSISMLDAC